MTKLLNLCIASLVLSGCGSALDLQDPIEYAIVRIPNTQTDKLLSIAHKNWMIGVLEECSWQKTDKDLISNYRFELRRQRDSVIGQLVKNSIFIMTENNEIIECKITEGKSQEFVDLFN